LKSKNKDYQRQADEIAGAILGCPDDWCGIVHVTRKAEAGLLADRLARRGLQDRVWVPPTEQGGKWLGTQDQVLAWEQRKAEVPNSIMVSWQFWQGFDGLSERICIVAKTPFPSLQSEYEKQRMQYSHRFYNQRTAWALIQALGRTRRGREQDYDTEEEMRGYVAIGDGNWTRVKRYLSEDFLEAMVL
jgi:Rad3-related DNA helicase